MAYAKKKKSKASAQHVDISSNSVTDDEHSKLIRWVNSAEDATISSRTLSEKCRDYYDSKQWTGEEQSKLARQKQAATVINRCKPKIDSLMGMERANRTTAKAQPRTPKETGGALAATEATRFVLQDNDYDQARSATWENMTIEGSGGLEICVEPNDDETYKIIIRNIMWDRLIYDPHSRRKDFSDARFLGQVVWMDYDEACVLYPEAKDILEVMQGNSNTYDDKPRWMDNTRRRVKIVELYYRRDDGDWWYCCFTRGGYCEEPKVSPFKNEEGETEHAYEFASLFVDREGGRYGAMRQFLDIQDEINKRRSKALHLLSVRQTFGAAGAVADVNKARAELAKPDGHLEVAYGEFGKDFGVLPTGDMAAGQFNLLSEAKMEIDSVGANSATMGKDKTVQSGVALRQRAMTGQTELAPMFDVLKNLDIRVYRKVWNRVKQYWKSEMWIRVTDDENNLKFVGLNKPVTKGEDLLAKARAMQPTPPPAAMQDLQQRIDADPTMKEVIDTRNEIVSMDVDIIMDEAPDTVTQEIEDFQAMAEMVKSGFPIPPEAVIMSSPLSNKDKIIKMMKEKPQLPPEVQKQMQDMQEQMKKLTQENQALKSGQQESMAKMQAESQMEQQKLAAEQQSAQADFALQKQKQDGDLQLQRERAAAEIQLKREVAEADLQLERMKIDASSEAEVDKAIQKVSNLATIHQTKIQGIFDKEAASREAQAEGEQKAQEQSDSTAQVAAMQKQFADALKQVVDGLTAKKHVTMTLPTGGTATAEVSMAS